MTKLHSQTLRAVDANLDRATEGLRVLEDVARFCLNSLPVSSELKSLRNRLLEGFPFSGVELTSARDSYGDVGRNPEAAKLRSSGLGDTVTANARRVEQSLRVLEELARLPDAKLNGSLFEETRYRVYDLEKILTGMVGRQSKLSRLGLHYIVTEDASAAARALQEPETTVQLNHGGSSRGEFWRQASCLAECRTGENGLFIIGEYTDVAVAVNADGVAIGGDSLPIEVARNLLAGNQLIGYTVEYADDAAAAVGAGADYLICPEVLHQTLSDRGGIPVVSPQGNRAA